MASTPTRTASFRIDPEKGLRVALIAFVGLSSVILSATVVTMILGWMPMWPGLALAAPFAWIVALALPGSR
jgi:hypothetical protein